MGSRGIALLFLDHGTRWGEGSASRPGRSLPPGTTQYSLYRKLGGPQGCSWQVRKLSPPPVFDPRTIRPLASRYTNWATRPINFAVHNFNRLKSVVCFVCYLIGCHTNIQYNYMLRIGWAAFDSRWGQETSFSFTFWLVLASIYSHIHWILAPFS